MKYPKQNGWARANIPNKYEIKLKNIQTKCAQNIMLVSDVWSLAICRVGQDKEQKVSACLFLFGSHCWWYKDDDWNKFRRCSISFEIRCKVQWWRDDVDKMKRWRDIRRASPYPIWVTWLMWRWCFFYLGHLAVRHKLMKVSHGQMWHWQAIPMTNMIIWGPNWKMWWHEMVIWMI